jgi:hypothetical protein
MAMIRKQIYLDAETDRKLKSEAKRRGISEAAVIRERLAEDTPGLRWPVPDSDAREKFQKMLDDVRAKAGWGPGTGWKFDREEIYAERLDKARPDRHKRTGRRRRSS